MEASRRRAVAPVMTDVAREAGVSIGTVSNVINHPERVAEATRARVLDAIERLGFVRNNAASELASGSNPMLGMLLSDLQNSFFVNMAVSAQRAARAAGHNYVGGAALLQPLIERRRGVLKAMGEDGGGVGFETLDPPEVNAVDGIPIARWFLDRPPAARPGGVVFATVNLARGFIDHVHAAGVAVPDEVRVIGCDDDWEARGAAIEVSGVDTAIKA